MEEIQNTTQNEIKAPIFFWVILSLLVVEIYVLLAPNSLSFIPISSQTFYQYIIIPFICLMISLFGLRFKNNEQVRNLSIALLVVSLAPIAFFVFLTISLSIGGGIHF